jgi:hypothetical protein
MIPSGVRASDPFLFLPLKVEVLINHSWEPSRFAFLQSHVGVVSEHTIRTTRVMKKHVLVSCSQNYRASSKQEHAKNTGSNST